MRFAGQSTANTQTQTTTYMKIIDIVRYATDPISYMDELVNGNETLLVQCPEDKSVVILSMEEYNRLKAIEWRQQSNESPTPRDNNK